MIGAVTRAIDNVLGRGEAAVTVPPLDGALRPNSILDEARARYHLDGVDCLAVVDGELLASAGNAVHILVAKGEWKLQHKAEESIVCIAPLEDGLALGLTGGQIAIIGGERDGCRYRATELTCLTAMAAFGSALYVANGSANNRPDEWQRDLLEGNASGSIWRIDLNNGDTTQIAAGLAWPAGVAPDASGVVYSEAWRHRLVRIDAGGDRTENVLYHDLSGYPGRMSPAKNGWWLAVFAPRIQLVEFILREPVYRQRMLKEVAEPYWISPKLRSGRSFYEPLQGGGVKHLGRLKPWAPTMSAGLCVLLDAGFQPASSLQSRADGKTHGVTGVVEYEGDVYVAARGDGVVVRIPEAIAGGAQ